MDGETTSERAQTIFDDLRNGHDCSARTELCSRLEVIIRQSYNGEISIGDFRQKLNAILGQAIVYSEVFNNKK